jgi:spore coat protein U-like protein
MKGVRWLVSLAVLGAALLAGGGSASAQSCSITATAMSFGSYNVFSSTDLPSTSTVTYNCTNLFLDTVTVYLSKGSASSNNPRQMVSGANRLNYNLYMDAAHTHIWGDPNPNSYSRFYLWSSPNVTLTVYGLIPALQDVAVGSYLDNVTATINF